MEVVAFETAFVAVPADAATIRESPHQTELVFSGDLSATLWLLPPIPAEADAMAWLLLQPDVSPYLTPDDVVPRPDLGLTCALRIPDNPTGSRRLDGLCGRLARFDAADVAIPTSRSPRGIALATGTLFDQTVTVRVGPGMTQQRGPGEGELTWGCFSPAAPPSSDGFFADRPDCWVSTYVTVAPTAAWPAVAERWLVPEETLVGGAVSETDAWITSRIVGPDGRVQEVRVRRALRGGASGYVCLAGQRMVPGADEKAAFARVEAMCAALSVVPVQPR